MDLSAKQRPFHSASKFQSKVYLNFILDLQNEYGKSDAEKRQQATANPFAGVALDYFFAVQCNPQYHKE